MAVQNTQLSNIFSDMKSGEKFLFPFVLFFFFPRIFHNERHDTTVNGRSNIFLQSVLCKQQTDIYKRWLFALISKNLSNAL